MELNLDKDINGEQLVQELKAAGVTIIDNAIPFIEGDILTLNVAATDEVKTQKVWDAHVAENWEIKRAEARQAVLDKLGLSADEVAALLG